MPYLQPADRKPYAEPLAELHALLVATDPAKRQGALNFMATTLATALLTGDPHYRDIGEAVSALECAKLELYRRVAAPYEDAKAAENGDVYPSLGHS
jgi:hypothetical protein